MRCSVSYSVTATCFCEQMANHVEQHRVELEQATVKSVMARPWFVSREVRLLSI